MKGSVQAERSPDIQKEKKGIRKVMEEMSKDKENTGCSSCDSHTCDKKDCKSCAQKKKIMKLPANPANHIKHVVGIVSGKGGVGKSSVTSMVAVELQRQGYKVGILDADVTGPSIPQIFGMHTVAKSGKGKGIEPVETPSGIKMMSVNVLLEAEDTPVVWRGPVITGVVKQFWTDVLWRELDYLLIDMPPGTGDVALTVFQSLPVDGIIMVTSPQTLVGMIVKKACKMADKLSVPILGLIENYSYIVCSDCGKKMPVFGKSRVEAFAEESNLRVLAKLPVDEKLAEAGDEGTIEKYHNEEMVQAVGTITALVEK
ncbi:MAG: Mrp/NBP35 family ATP-binding protein [Lachnospiraceae bacterium]|nr:Mrp/NBP35 family ATP-binding protein [Lachnospiraceae bacterium]